MKELSVFAFIFVLTIFLGCSENSQSATYEDPFPRTVSEIAGGPVAELPIDYSDDTTARYIIDVEKWEIPNNGSDPTKTTENLQAAINWAVDTGFTHVVLPAGIYEVGIEGNSIYTGGIELKDSMVFEMDSLAEIRMTAHDKWNACAIAITEKKHVTIRGGTIRGDRYNHTYTKRSDGADAHDEGHNLCIQNESQYILVENVLFKEATGDGILMVGQKGVGSSVKDITVRNCEFNDNRRQGISIVGGVRIHVFNNEIHHTNGTSPQFGIDIESLSYESKEIRIIKNYFHHNAGGDVVNTDGRNVLIAENIFEEGDSSRNIDGPVVYWKNADQTIRNNQFTVVNGSVNGKVGIIGYSNDRGKVNPATTYILDNTCEGCGMYMYQSSDIVIRGNTMRNGYIVLQKFTNATIENNEVSHDSKCWAWRFKEVTGNASGNTYNGELFDIPLSNKVWTGCWIN